MIKTLTIQNYQSHRNTGLQLDKGVNVIVAANREHGSDCGKSAILRAALWAITNKPGGEKFRSSWGGRTLVEIETTEGQIVGREKHKENLYYTDDKEYKALKGDVPEDIKEALNMDEVNIQNQLDPPFLLSASSGDVAKFFNKVTNLSEIDTTISNVNSEIRANRRNIENTEAQIAELEKQQASFEYIQQMEADVKRLERAEEELDEIDAEIKELETILAAIASDRAEIAEIEPILKAEPQLTKALALVETKAALDKDVWALAELLHNIEDDRKEINSISKILKAEGRVNEALQLVKELEEIDREGTSLKALLQAITNCKAVIRTKEQYIQSNEEVLHKLMPKRCPLCNK